MKTLELLFRNFFTHKDFLPPPENWPGTLFSPLQIGFCALVALAIILASRPCARMEEDAQKRIYFLLWLLMALSEPLIIYYDAAAGASFFFDWSTALSLWPCSIFLYTAPFAIFGKGKGREAACGYICTAGFLGGLVNFIYPASYLSYYSCLSMAGLRTIFYHGSMIFTAATMLLSGYHSFRCEGRWRDLLLPAVPALLVSIPANIANFLIPGADYMFFRLSSFFFAPIGAALPLWLCMLLVYGLYLAAHCIPYLPSWLAARRKSRELLHS